MQKPFERSFTIIEGLFYAGYYPGGLTKQRTLLKLQKLYESGIRQIVNLTEEDEKKVDGSLLRQYQDDLDEFNSDKKEKLLHKRFPIKDMDIPTPAEMRAIHEFIDLNVKNKVPQYLTCVGGYGRTGTTLASWFIKHSLADLTNVFNVLNEYRQEDVTHHRPSPQREKQKRFVTENNWKKDD